MSNALIGIKEVEYSWRRSELARKTSGSVVFIASGIPRIQSRDLEFDFRPDSDFLYFTGFHEQESVLVLDNRHDRSTLVLYLRDRDILSERWSGSRLGLKRAGRRFQVDEVRNISHFLKDIPSFLSGAETVFLNAGQFLAMDHAIFSLFSLPTSPRASAPSFIGDLRAISAELRFIKSKTEINLVRKAVEITIQAFQKLHADGIVRKGCTEFSVAAALEKIFAEFGGQGVAFPTIVASSSNATCLHHRASRSLIKADKLVLVDAGASFMSYHGDITRVFPSSGRFSEEEKNIHSIVSQAVNRALKKCKPGSSLVAATKAAKKAMADNFANLGVMKGRRKSSIETIDRYFIHSIGHHLGLDVHDIHPLRRDKFNKPIPISYLELVPGNIITIEPGLYFPVDDLDVRPEYRGIGIRLEQDVLITKDGCEVLSASLPL